MGSLSPLKGITPDQLTMTSLLRRLESGLVEEVIVATNPNVEGETTALYLSRLIKPLGIRVTRLGLGLPVGGDLEYADEVTMAKALEGRREPSRSPDSRNPSAGAILPKINLQFSVFFRTETLSASIKSARNQHARSASGRVIAELRLLPPPNNIHVWLCPAVCERGRRSARLQGTFSGIGTDAPASRLPADIVSLSEISDDCDPLKVH
jgi:hypothetical protein